MQNFLIKSLARLVYGRWPKTVTSRRLAAKCLVGFRVHSFDFDGRDLHGEAACYVTGIVVGILKAGDLAEDGETAFHDCDRYVIAAESRTFSGKETNLVYSGQQFFPPLNGTPTYMDHVMTGVVLAEGAAA